MNEDKLEQVYDNLEQGIEYVAYLKHDGVVISKVSSYSVDGLAEELRKLESAEKDFIVKTAAEMLLGGEIDTDYDDLIKESKNDN